MDLVLRYLENSVRLRNLAATESDPRVRAELERHAEAYRKLAAQRALLGVLLFYRRCEEPLQSKLYLHYNFHRS